MAIETFPDSKVLNIVNYNVELEKCHFENCASEIAGGAVYINTGHDIEHSTHFEGSTFTNCSSQSYEELKSHLGLFWRSSEISRRYFDHANVKC